MLYDDLVPSEGQWLAHFGIKGQKWGVRRYQNPDGSLTEEGKKRYLNPDGTYNKEGHKQLYNILKKHPDTRFKYISSNEKSILRSRLSNEQIKSLVSKTKALNKLDKKIDNTELAYFDKNGNPHRTAEGSKLLKEYDEMWNEFRDEISGIAKNFCGEYGNKKYDTIDKTYEAHIERLLFNIGNGR